MSGEDARCCEHCGGGGCAHCEPHNIDSAGSCIQCVSSAGVCSKHQPPAEAAPDEAAAREWDGSLADAYSWANRTPAECLAAARSIERAAYVAGRKAAFEEVDHNDDALVTEVACAIGETLKHQPHMGGNCRVVHGEETNRRSARAAIRAIARIRKGT